MPPDYISLLYLAHAEPIGLLLQTPDPRYTLQRLYQARTEAGDPALADLQIRLSTPPDGNLAITHQHIDAGEL